MDRVATYRTLLKELFSQHPEHMNHRPQPETETEVTFDDVRDHYMVLRLGWIPNLDKPEAKSGRKDAKRQRCAEKSFTVLTALRLCVSFLFLVQDFNYSNLIVVGQEGGSA